MSTALEIGTQLVQKLNNEGGEACVDALYADDVVSIEGQGTKEMPARMEGVDAIRGKTNGVTPTTRCTRPPPPVPSSVIAMTSSLSVFISM